MPANELSLALTDAYRERTEQLRETVAAQARLLWARIGRAPADERGGIDLDAAYETWLAAVAPLVAAAQGGAVQASHGYLTAFLTAELDEAVEAASADGSYVGLSRDGRSVRDALGSPLIGIKAALKDGLMLDRALAAGRARALRAIGVDIDHAARRSLQDALIADDRVAGYRRAVRGTCAACLAVAAQTYSPGVRFPVHPGCQCVSEPVVRGVRSDAFPRLTGAALFAALSEEEQDAGLGPQAAALVRSGAISLESLVAASPLEQGDDFIYQGAAEAS